jgi:hypothetical protein
MGASIETFKLRNFGEFYYPSDALQEGLIELIIFCENTTKRNIPNGSIFVYEKCEYKPEILLSDVGCGITSVLTDQLEYNIETIRDILKVVDEIGIHIGQGNHFIDFTTGHPTLRQSDVFSNMIYIHSDFNSENKIPSTYREAEELETIAKKRRLYYLDKLTSLLGISCEFYRDWTHNSVELKDDFVIYRKGSINLEKTDGVGALALNPVDGIYLYVAKNSDLYNSMQHGTGRIGSVSEVQKLMKKESLGMARGYYLSENANISQLNVVKNGVYNSMDRYIEQFGSSESCVGVCVPELVVTTKN